MSQFCHTSIIVVQLLIHIQFFYLVKYAKKCFFPLKRRIYQKQRYKSIPIFRCHDCLHRKSQGMYLPPKKILELKNELRHITGYKIAIKIIVFYTPTRLLLRLPRRWGQGDSYDVSLWLPSLWGKTCPGDAVPWQIKHKGKQTSEVRGGKGERDGKKACRDRSLGNLP